MRRILRLACIACLSVSSLGCFLDDMRREKPGGSFIYQGGSEKARQIERDVDFNI